MVKTLSIILTLLLSLVTLSAFAQGTVIVLDRFDDDPLGQAPGIPDVGTSGYFGSGAHSVINDYGSQSLRSVDSSGTEGYVIQWLPTSTPAIFEASYRFRMESFSGVAGPILYHRFYVSTTGSQESIIFYWKTDGSLELIASTAAIPSFTWTTGTTYDVRLKVNCTADTTSLWVNGAPLVADMALGFDCTTMVDFSDGTSFGTLSSRSLDDLKIVAGDSIFVDGFESGDTSKWSASLPPINPDGDTCATAKPYSGGTLIGDLSDNTASGTTDTCGTGNTIDEWVSYTATCNGTVTVNTCYPSTAVDTILSAWSDASCSGITEVACNDDAPGAPPECDLGGLNRKSKATFSVTTGSTYVFRVSTFNDGVGVYEIGANCTP